MAGEVGSKECMNCNTYCNQNSPVYVKNIYKHTI